MAYDFSELGMDSIRVHSSKNIIQVPLYDDDIKMIISALSSFAANQRIDVTFTKCYEYGYITDDSLTKFNEELNRLYMLQKRLITYLSKL